MKIEVYEPVAGGQLSVGVGVGPRTNQRAFRKVVPTAASQERISHLFLSDEMFN